MFVFENPNPAGQYTEDCAVRAFAIATGQDWDTVYLDLVAKGYAAKVMPNTKRIYMAYLKEKGFTRTDVPDHCPDCYTVRDFCAEHPQGTYILATDSHVVCAISGSWYDTWDSGDEAVITVWQKGEETND